MIPPDGEIVRRRPLLAVFLSGLFPGLGQLYNRERLKAALFSIAGILTAFGPWSPADVDIDLGNLEAGLQNVLWASLPFMAVATWSVVDAYRAAKRTHR